MKILTRIRSAARNLFRRERVERDLDAEVHSYASMLEEEKMAQGMNPKNARRAARIETGGHEQLKEEVRSARAGTWVESVGQDIRFGARTLRKNPGFTAVAVLTLALGIGANTAIFSVIQVVLLNPLPYKEPNKLVVMWEQDPSRGWFRNIISAANFQDWKKQSQSFTDMAAYYENSYDISGGGSPDQIHGEEVSASFFSVLGVSPALGRVFGEQDNRPSEASRSIILSYALWKNRFGGDPTVIGRDIRINHVKCPVVGIMPPQFFFPPWSSKSDLWIAGLDLRSAERTKHRFVGIGRLKSDVSFNQAQAEMDGIAQRLEQQYPDQKGWGVQLINLHEQVVGNTRPALLVLFGAVCIVLLIACANLGNLQLARVGSRDRELTTRLALGAGASRLLRQLLTESVMLAMLGGGLGLLMASVGIRVLVLFAPAGVPGLEHASLDSGVLVFTLILSLSTGVLFGLIPAWKASRAELAPSLKEGGRSLTGSFHRGRLGTLLVAAEAALALILLVGAGLMMRTFVAITKVDLGFDPHNVIAMNIALRRPGLYDHNHQVQFFDALLQKVRSLPGTDSVAVIDGTGLPPDGGAGMSFLIEGRPDPPPSERPDASYRVISSDYFRAMGIPLLRGRFLSDSDATGTPLVAVVSDKLARDFWPQGDPIGQRIQFPGIEDGPPIWFTIVGVVKSAKNMGLDVEARAELYVSYRQFPIYFAPRVLLLKSQGNPASLAASIRSLVQALDPEQPVADVRTVDEIISNTQTGWRFPMILLGIFAALAMTLAAVGIYGVVSHSVGQRVHEIGIRMALGAGRGHIFALILRQVMVPISVGIVVGLAGALVLTRLMSTLLYGVTSTDIFTYVAMSTTLAAVAFVAGWLPARRAANVDPMIVLRYE